MTARLTLTLKLLLVVAVAGSTAGQGTVTARAQEPTSPAGSVCFYQDGHPTCVQQPVLGAESAAPATPQALLSALLAGPSPDERSRGIQSAIPAGTRLVSAEAGGDTITVRLAFPPDFLSLDPALSSPETMLAGLPRARLTPAASDAIVYQVATTLDPLGYRHVHVQAEDPAAPGTFRPVSAYLPAVEVPAKGSWPPGSLPPQKQPPLDISGRPQGGLSGKTIYLSAGHGWYWNGYLWRTQRPPYPDQNYDGPIIEDHNNAEVVNQYLARYLWNAGADVWMVRERDMHALEGVVDDQSPSFVTTGDWQAVGQGGYGVQTTAVPPSHNPAAARLVWAAVMRPLGADLLFPQLAVRPQASQPAVLSSGGYLTAATTAAPVATATATWTTPPVDQEGDYGLYVWYVPGPDRAPDAHYTIHHAGGVTELSLDQRHHGITWRYLGSYPVRAGQGVTVILDNRSDHAGTLVVADAVRLGGGTFDSLAGVDTEAPYPPDKPWWEVSAYYHTQRLGMDPDEWAYFDDVTARPFWAKWEHAETGDDPVYISWHTNGYNGHNDKIWGTVSYIHDYQPVPGSAALQDFVHAELINDVRAGWDPDWRDLGQKSRNLGEVRELWDDDPGLAIPGLLLEVAYHDHITNTDALKDPRFALISARAVYQGVVKYYADKDGQEGALLPEPPTHLTVRNAGPGQVALSWRPSPNDGAGLGGHPAERYRVYTSPDGLSWGAGQPVYATQHTLTGLEAHQLIFIRVTALNAGGESFPTPVLAARVSPYGAANILIVDGFDRIDRHGLIVEDDPVEGLNARMFLECINSFDYSREHGEAIPFPFDSALNEAVIDGELNLADYSLVDWFLGEEASVDHTFDSAEQSALAAYLDGGGGLLVSGSEIGWDLDILNNGRDFYRTYLRATCPADDAGTYLAAPAGGSLWFQLVNPILSAAQAAGISLAHPAGAAPASRFALPQQIPFVDNYDVDFADQLAPLDSTPWLSYVGGLEGTAAVLHDGGGCRKLVYLGFPFETIEAEGRSQVMSWILNWFSQDCLNLYGQHLAHLPVVLKGYPPPEAEPPPPPEPTETPTPPPQSTDLIPNGGFETDAGWDLLSTGHPAAYVTDPVHAGQRAGQALVPAGQAGYSSLSTSVDLPDQAPLTLSFWFYPMYNDYGAGDLQYVSLTDEQGATYVLWRARQNDRQWLQANLDLTPYQGQSVVLRFGVSNDGDYNTVGLAVDDVSLPVVAE